MFINGAIIILVILISIVRIGVEERALLAGILLIDSCLCETEKVRHIDGEEGNLFAVS